MNAPQRARERRVGGAVLVALVHLAAMSGCSRVPPALGSALAGDAAPSPSAATAREPPRDGAPASAPIDPCRIAGFRGPLLARWTAAQRGALDNAMRDGIAVVSANDCRGVRLLPRCHARGHYGYLGRTTWTYGVDLSGDEELRINAPLADATSGSDGGAGAIRVDLAVVGSRATTRNLLDPQELTGDCEGATHYVDSAEVGAAVVSRGGHPDPAKALDPCRSAHPGDVEPPAACAQPVAIRISPIAELGSLITYDQAPSNTVAPIGTCPEGMVVSRLRCARPPVEAPHLCAFGDAQECPQQCELGDVNSCDVFAFMLWHGKGLRQDIPRATTVYAKACEQADSIACNNLGQFLNSGDGVAKDETRAATLFDRACSLGLADACGNLGLAYLSGTGVATNAVRGTSLLERACNAGSSGSCLVLARRLRRGTGATGDAARSNAMLEELCDVNNGPSCDELARIHYLGEGVPSDRARAASLFTHACRAGDDKACVMLGLQYRQADGVARDDVLATRLMEQACTHGAVDGCLNLGIAYEHGKGVAPDTARAAKLYEEACTGDDATGCMYLADFLSEGVAVAKDAKRAGSLYRRACELGEKKACARVGGPR